MTFRRLTACAIGLVAASVTACSSNISGHGNDGSGPGSQQAGSSQGNAPAPKAAALGPNTTASQLANALTTALTSVKSAHVSLTASLLGQSITGSGDEQLDNGKLKAFQVTENLPGGIGSIAIVIVGSKAWVKVPSGLGTGGNSDPSKPWRVISANSSDPTVRSLATSLNSTLSSASIAAAGKFAEAAKSIKVLGKQTVDGVSATHVHLVVDPSKIASTIPGSSSSSLQQLGLTSIPVDLYLDDQNRPVLTSTSIAVQGQKVTTKVEISKYDQPVSINPPPASQIAPSWSPFG